MTTSFLSSTAQRLSQKQNTLRWLPIFLLLLAFVIKLLLPGHYVILIREDGMLESIQLILFILTTCMATTVSKALISRKRLFAATMWALFALACFFISMEEISWGQRLMSVATQVDKSVNLQGETNLHNHKHLQIWFGLAYLIIGLVGTFGGRLFKKLDWLLPARTLSWYFLPVFLFNLHIFIGAAIADYYGLNWLVPARELLNTQQLLYKDQEVIEVLLAMGFFLHANYVLASMSQRSA